MTLAPVPAEPPPMTVEEARALTDRLQETLGTVWELLLQAHTGGAWKALGYETWEDYCHQEFATDRLRLPVGERRQAVAAMRQEGMTVREVAAALGVSDPTVERDTAAMKASNDADDDVVDAEIVEEDDDEEDPWANAPEADPPEADDAPPPSEPFLKAVRRTAAAIGNLTEKLAQYQTDPRYNRNAQHVEAILVPALDLLIQEIDTYKENLK